MTDREALRQFEEQLRSAQAVLDSGFGKLSGENDYLYQRRKEMAKCAISALRERMEREDGWISVEDRLPIEGANVLIDIPFRGCHINYVAYMESGLWYVTTMYGRSGLNDVTHWRPLPQPPVGNEVGK